MRGGLSHQQPCVGEGVACLITSPVWVGGWGGVLSHQQPCVGEGVSCLISSPLWVRGCPALHIGSGDLVYNYRSPAPPCSYWRLIRRTSKIDIFLYLGAAAGYAFIQGSGIRGWGSG